MLKPVLTAYLLPAFWKLLMPTEMLYRWRIA